MYDAGDVGFLLFVGGFIGIYTLTVGGFGWYVLASWGAWAFAAYLSCVAVLTGVALLDLSTAGRVPPGGPPRPPSS